MSSGWQQGRGGRCCTCDCSRAARREHVFDDGGRKTLERQGLRTIVGRVDIAAPRHFWQLQFVTDAVTVGVVEAFAGLAIDADVDDGIQAPSRDEGRDGFVFVQDVPCGLASVFAQRFHHPCGVAPQDKIFSCQGVLAACEGHACDGHLVEGRPRHGVTRSQGIQHHASSKKLDG